MHRKKKLYDKNKYTLAGITNLTTCPLATLSYYYATLPLRFGFGDYNNCSLYTQGKTTDNQTAHQCMGNTQVFFFSPEVLVKVYLFTIPPVDCCSEIVRKR